MCNDIELSPKISTSNITKTEWYCCFQQHDTVPCVNIFNRLTFSPPNSVCFLLLNFQKITSIHKAILSRFLFRHLAMIVFPKRYQEIILYAHRAWSVRAKIKFRAAKKYSSGGWLECNEGSSPLTMQVMKPS